MDVAIADLYFCDMTLPMAPVTTMRRRGPGHWPEAVDFTYAFSAEGHDLPLRLSLLESGIFILDRDRHFEHPTPDFDRVFMFAEGWCRVTIAGAVRRLRPGTIYLLPAELSFSVDYRAGSRLYYHHVRLLDALGLPVFSRARDLCALTHDGFLADLVTPYGDDSPVGVARWQSALFASVMRMAEPFLADLVDAATRAHPFAELMAYVRSERRATLSVRELARRYHASPGALSKRFSRAIGRPLKDHLIDELIQHARRLLGHGDQSVKQIAAELGYADTFYFNRIFRRRTGHTPTTYRALSRSR